MKYRYFRETVVLRISVLQGSPLDDLDASIDLTNRQMYVFNLKFHTLSSHITGVQIH